MVDLKKIMEKLNSQKSDVKEEKSVVVPDEESDDDLDDESDDVEVEKEVVSNDKSKDQNKTKVLSNIESLQNNGIFRYELLAVNHLIAQELKVLNYQLMKLSGQDGK